MNAINTDADVVSLLQTEGRRNAAETRKFEAEARKFEAETTMFDAATAKFKAEVGKLEVDKKLAPYWLAIVIVIGGSIVSLTGLAWARLFAGGWPL